MTGYKEYVIEVQKDYRTIFYDDTKTKKIAAILSSIIYPSYLKMLNPAS